MRKTTTNTSRGRACVISLLAERGPAASVKTTASTHDGKDDVEEDYWGCLQASATYSTYHIDYTAAPEKDPVILE